MKYYLLFKRKYEYQGKDKTDDVGIWKLKHLDFKQYGVRARGEKAKVVKRVDGRGRHKHVCKPAICRPDCLPEPRFANETSQTATLPAYKP